MPHELSGAPAAGSVAHVVTHHFTHIGFVTATLLAVGCGDQPLTLKAHTRPVYCVAFSPDGKRIASGSADGMIKVWDATTLQVILTLAPDNGPIFAVAFSPDGKAIVSGSMDHRPGQSSVRVWNAISGDQILVLPGLQSRINTVAYSPDGTHIATGSSESTVQIWDAKTGVERLALNRGLFEVFNVSYSPDGTRILTSCKVPKKDNAVMIWNAAAGQPISSFEDRIGLVHAIFAPDGKRVASAVATAPTTTMNSNGKLIENDHVDAVVKIWDTETTKQLMALAGHTAGVNSVAFSPDGKRILTGSDDATIRLWEATNGRSVLILTNSTPVLSVAFSPDGKRIAGACANGTIKLWNNARD